MVQTTHEMIRAGMGHHQAGRLVEAERMYREVLAREPGHADALHLMGVLAYQSGKHEVAIELIGRAIAVLPRMGEYHSNRAHALRAMGRWDEAIAGYRKALELKRDLGPAQVGLALAHNGLGNALKEQGRLEEAIEEYRRAAVARPEMGGPHVNISSALRMMGKLGAALKACERAIALEPGLPEAHNTLGTILASLGRGEEAVRAYRKAVELRPEVAATHSNLLLAMHYPWGVTGEDVYAEHLRWAKVQSARVEVKRDHGNVREGEKKLRVAYVSADFRRHPVGALIEPIVKGRNREAFEVWCYSDVASGDKVTQRIRRSADGWREVAGVDDERLARLIVEDKIDVLVDLAGHTAGNRMMVFARWPAPVQVTYFGYPDTTGLASVDAKLTDAWHDPPGEHDGQFVEKLVRLGRCAWCYQPLVDVEVEELPAKRNGYVTFGSLNNPVKLTPRLMEGWARIMKSVPGSRIVLLMDSDVSGPTLEQPVEVLLENGVERERIERVARCTHEEYMRLCNRIDISLDAFPYNGLITTCNAMWMGVPVVTLAGETHVQRAGLSVLSQVEMEELVARDLGAYERIAIGLARDVERVERLRGELRWRMQRSALCDYAGLTRELEKVYRDLWQGWCASCR